MFFTIRRRRVEGRTFIEVEATPQTAEARALLREFQAGLRDLETRWRGMVRAYERANREEAKRAAPAKKGAAKKAAAKKAAPKKAGRPKRGR